MTIALFLSNILSEVSMEHIHLRITELLKEKGISKNRICKDLDIPSGNFKLYCRDELHRIDSNMIIKHR